MSTERPAIPDSEIEQALAIAVRGQLAKHMNGVGVWVTPRLLGDQAAKDLCASDRIPKPQPKGLVMHTMIPVQIDFDTLVDDEKQVVIETLWNWACDGNLMLTLTDAQSKFNNRYEVTRKGLQHFNSTK